MNTRKSHWSNKKAHAFSLFEVLFAMIIFAGALPAIINCFLANKRMPRIDNTAIALIADVDNCVTNIDKIVINSSAKADKKDNNVSCLLLNGLRFHASKTKATDSVWEGASTTLNALIIQEYPNVGAVNKIYYYTYNP